MQQFILFVNKCISDKCFEINEVIQHTVHGSSWNYTASPKRRPCDSRDHMRWALIILSIVLHRQLVNVMGWNSPSLNSLFQVWEWKLVLLRAMMAKGSQTPRHGYALWEEQIYKQSLEDGLKITRVLLTFKKSLIKFEPPLPFIFLMTFQTCVYILEFRTKLLPQIFLLLLKKMTSFGP